MSARPPSPGPSAPAPAPLEGPDNGELTLRQQEILALVRAGKGNKDIANELGIGLGTVKQHVVALFRKLNVGSRAQAISRSSDMDWQAHRGSAAYLSVPADDSLIELRPTCILSIAACAADGSPADDQAWRHLNRLVSSLAADHDCTLVAVPGKGIDLLFGLHRVGEHDARTAVTLAQTIAAQIPAEMGTVRAGLASGYLVASMHRLGGWTGESVAGHAIARARDLRDNVEPGELRADLSARRLLAFDGMDMNSLAWRTDDVLFLIKRPDLLHPCVPQPSQRPLVNRVDELLTLRRATDQAQSAGIGLAALIEGEAGMGKTALAEAFVAVIAGQFASRLDCRMGPDGAGLVETLAALGRQKGRPVAKPGMVDALRGLERAMAAGPMLLLIDDLHLAQDADAMLLAELARRTAKVPLVLVVCARRLKAAPLGGVAWNVRLRLPRLKADEIETIIAAEAGSRMGADMRGRIAALADGVPLFALELANSLLNSASPDDKTPVPPMNLVSLVLSRIDPLGLHRGLLRLASRSDDMGLDQLKSLWPSEYGDLDLELKRAVTGGVLSMDSTGTRIAVRHPLVREVLRAVLLAKPNASLPDEFEG